MPAVPSGVVVVNVGAVNVAVAIVAGGDVALFAVSLAGFSTSSA